MKGPEPWKDEEAMETDLQTLLSMYLINHEEVELKAFRLGWKAGARYSAFQLLHWIRVKILGHGDPEAEEVKLPVMNRKTERKAVKNDNLRTAEKGGWYGRCNRGGRMWICCTG